MRIINELNFGKNLWGIPNARNLILQSFSIENYLLYKLKQYVANPEICFNEYNISCARFLNLLLELEMNKLEMKLGKDKVKL